MADYSHRFPCSFLLDFFFPMVLAGAALDVASLLGLAAAQHREAVDILSTYSAEKYSGLRIATSRNRKIYRQIFGGDSSMWTDLMRCFATWLPTQLQVCVASFVPFVRQTVPHRVPSLLLRLRLPRGLLHRRLFLLYYLATLYVIQRFDQLPLSFLVTFRLRSLNGATPMGTPRWTSLVLKAELMMQLARAVWPPTGTMVSWLVYVMNLIRATLSWTSQRRHRMMKGGSATSNQLFAMMVLLRTLS